MQRRVLSDNARTLRSASSLLALLCLSTMAAFGDVGKAFKDLSSVYTADYKLSAALPKQGALATSASVAYKGGAYPADVRGGGRGWWLAATREAPLSPSQP